MATRLGYGKLGNEADQHDVYEQETGRTVATTRLDSDGRRAALFAAAPDLLIACEVFAEAYRDYIDGDGSGLDYAARVVKDAIAKATNPA